MELLTLSKVRIKMEVKNDSPFASSLSLYERNRYHKGPSTYYVILFTVFYVKYVTFFLVNRVEHQKLNQTTAELPFG